MTEINELIAPPAVHTTPNEDCPFCPEPDQSNYTTWAGADNDSKDLEAIMDKPPCLTDRQGGARPQTSREDAKGFIQEQSPPEPKPYDDSKPYTFQAHHLISGNQALKGEPFEDWIVASGLTEKDTGYSINCTGNGFWAPSTPKKYVKRWSQSKGLLDDNGRQSEAETVMEHAGAQIHIGPHNIHDPDDPEGKNHSSYDDYIKNLLQEMYDREQAWPTHCFLCKPDAKKQTTHHVHDHLDNLSVHLRGKLTGARATWDVFISKYALEYHKKVCTHIMVE